MLPLIIPLYNLDSKLVIGGLQFSIVALKIETFDKRIGQITLLILGLLGVIVLSGRSPNNLIRSVYPQHNTNPPVTASLFIEFQQNIDPQSALDALTIQPFIAGQMNWEGSSFIFQPHQPWQANVTYTITIDESLQTRNGSGLPQAQSWTFTPRTPRIIYQAITESESAIYFFNLDEDTTSLLRAFSDEIIDFVPLPDQSIVALSLINEQDENSIQLLDQTEGSLKEVFVCQPHICLALDWSPQTQILSFTKHVNGEASGGTIWLYDLRSNTVTPLFQESDIPAQNPVWSHDGQMLALFDPSLQGIRILHISSDSEFFIPSQMGETGTFSPDGTSLIYPDIRRVGGQFYPELWIAHFDQQGQIERLLDAAEEDQSPLWSPDGRWVAFGRRRLDRQAGFGSQLFLYDPVSFETRQITTDPALHNFQFVWGPNSKYLILHRRNLDVELATTQIWLYDLVNERISPIATEGFNAQWSP